HREVGSHTKSFAAALRGALREDPDIILVGEMRDLETIRLALEAANTGHLVLGTLHTTNAAKTIDRIIEVFPAEEQAQVRNGLSTGLKLVVAQNLFKRVDRKGRCAALEILVCTPAVGNLIREGKTVQIPSAIQTGKQLGMQTLDDATMAVPTKDRRLTEHLLRQGSCDSSYFLPGKARFRVNIFSQRGSFSVVLRKLETKIPTIEELKLPEAFKRMPGEKNGLILVTGATGSGK